ncbi:LAGLIDADG family homing endonuclease [Halorutilales archaeon Cl-col2-1]
MGRLAVVVHASLPYDEEVLIWTPDDGFGFHEIGEVVEDEKEARAVSFDPENLRVSTHEITDYITNPRKDIYRVRLESGREVRVTEDHNLFTLDSEGKVDRIETEDAEGELVAVPHKLPEPVVDETEVDLVELLDGSEDIIAYASDGKGRGKGKNQGFTDVDWEGIGRSTRRHYEGRNSAPLRRVSPAEARDSDVDLCFKQSDFKLPDTVPVTAEFGWVLGFYIAEGYARRKHVVFTNKNEEYLDRVESWFEEYGTTISRNCDDRGVRQLTVSSALWSEIFRRLADEGSDKNIPDEAWNWSDDVLESLLEGLIDGDGHRRESRETFYTFNEDLAYNVVHLASRLGKLSSVYSRERETGTEWNVDVSEDAHKKGQYVPNVDGLLREYRHEAGMGMKEVAEKVGWSSKSSVSNLENCEYSSVKRGTLRKLREVYADEDVETRRLDSILDGGVRFERVESVEKTGDREVTYDLEVQPNGRCIENFIGGRGGVFLSNTAGFIDPGYEGQITLELSNLGTAPVALRPKEMRISQVVFTELSSRAELPYGEERGSKYQNQEGPTASRIQSDAEWETESDEGTEVDDDER